MKSIPVKKKKHLIAQSEATLLQLVRSHQGISRIELASLMGIAPSTIGIFVSRLIREGFLAEESIVKQDRGRPRTVLSLDPKGGYLLGVDIEATRIRAVRLNFKEEIEDSVSIKIDPDQGVDTVLNTARSAIQQVLPKPKNKILGLGIAAPGPFDSKGEKSLSYTYIKGWENISLLSYFRKHFQMPIYLESNLRSIASAELWFGQGRTLDNFVCITVRGGIGVGVVTHGQLVKGVHCNAGEIGLWLYPSGFLDKKILRAAFPSLPAHIELEKVASVRAVLKNITACIQAGHTSLLAKYTSSPSIEAVLDAYHQGDALTIQHLNTAADALGWAANQLGLLLDPALIILSGPFMELGIPFLKRIQNAAIRSDEARKFSFPPIGYSTLGELSGALGAAAQIVHYWVPAR
jgi:glucokinase